jgi:hypothetical protein
LKEIQLISLRRLDTIDISRKPGRPERKPAQELNMLNGALLGVILAELIMIAVLIP